MNFKLAAILLLASYSLAIPQESNHRTLLDADHAVLVRRAPKGSLLPSVPAPKRAAAGGGTPTPISAQLLQTFTRNVLYAGAASCDNLKAWDCTACQQPLVKATEVHGQFDYKVSATHGYVAVNRDLKQIIIAFRGSKDGFSIVKDIHVALKDFDIAGGGAMVHQGFYNVWSPSKDSVHSLVDDLVNQYSDYDINVTGHSLGAAVASMTALDLAITYANRNVILVGVSQPRVGNKAFALAIAHQPNLTAYRLEQANDFVGQYPQPDKGYVHNSPEYWIKTAFTSDVLFCPSAPGTESPLCSNSVHRQLNGQVHNFVLGYHFDGSCGGSQ